MRSPLQPARLALILGGMTAIMPLAVDMYLPALPTIAGELGVDASRAQLTLSSFFIGVALGQLFYGPLADRYGRRPLMLVGLALYLLASIGCALASSMALLTALRSLQALGACSGLVIALAVIRDCFAPQESARMISRMMLVFGVAPILAPLVGGQLLLWFGWRSIFWALALYGAAGYVAVLAWLPETRPAHTKGPTSVLSALAGFASVLRQRRFVGFALTRGFTAAGMFSYIAGSPFVFIVLHGVPAEHFGLLFGMNAIGLIAATQINARLLRNRGSEQILRAVLNIMAASGALLVAASLLPAVSGTLGFIALLVPLFVCVASNGFVNPNATALGMAPFGDRAGTASALIGSLSFVLAGIASALVSAFEAKTALPMALTIAVVEWLALAAYFLVVRRAPQGATGAALER